MNIIKKITSIFILICLFAGVKCFATSGTVNAPNGLVLRETASKTSNPITTISDSKTVEVIEKDGEWYKVKYNNYEGYLFAEYVNVSEQPQETVVSEDSTENSQAEQQPVQNNDIAIEATQPQEQLTIYPKETITLANAKVYLVPSITASIINNIEVSKTVTVNKVVNAWAYITFENNCGWIRKSLLKDDNQTVETPVEEPNKSEEELKTNFQTKKGFINASSSANVRESADKTSKIVTTLTLNTGVTVIGEEGTWYKITYGDYTGYVAKELISDNAISDKTTSRGGTTRETTTNNTEVALATSTTLSAGEKLVSFANKYLGRDYVYGGSSPSGFDCSGFVYYIYNSCGYSLSRDCQAQAASGIAVSKSELQQGDLVFFNNTGNGSIGHVGMYIGGGRFIHAANADRGIVTDTLNSGYYNIYYYSARRIVY